MDKYSPPTHTGGTNLYGKGLFKKCGYLAIKRNEIQGVARMNSENRLLREEARQGKLLGPVRNTQHREIHGDGWEVGQL